MRSRTTVGLTFVIFFVISLVTNILGPIVPAIIDTFHLDLTLAGFLPFSFFLAYGLWSIPAGMVIERHGEKPVLLGAFGLALGGSLLVAAHPTYRTALASLFLIGSGMAALQVAANPLLRVAGGEEHYAFNAVAAQLVFGLASFLSPRIYSQTSNWLTMYWLFAAIITVMLVLVALFPLPRVELTDDERIGGTGELIRKNPVVWAFFLAIFAYVGLEQGLANWMSEFLHLEKGLDPLTVGAMAVSNYWGMMTLGCVLGGFLLKFVDSRRVLLGFSALAAIALAVALQGRPEGFAACGFALSVMWSILFALALNSVKEHHGSFAGLLCTAIVGGAVVPLLIGRLGQTLGLKTALSLLYLPLLYVASVGFWARPLINNK